MQHEQMLVVRKEGKAHAQYNLFRSAFELLETVGCEPRDAFEETNDDLPPLERVERRMQHYINDLVKQQQEVLKEQQQEIDALKERDKVQQQEIDALKNQIKELNKLKKKNKGFLKHNRGRGRGRGSATAKK